MTPTQSKTNDCTVVSSVTKRRTYPGRTAIRFSSWFRDHWEAYKSSTVRKGPLISFQEIVLQLSFEWKKQKKYLSRSLVRVVGQRDFGKSTKICPTVSTTRVCRHITLKANISRNSWITTVSRKYTPDLWLVERRRTCWNIQTWVLP